jgi:hypothetical protein
MTYDEFEATVFRQAPDLKAHGFAQNMIREAYDNISCIDEETPRAFRDAAEFAIQSIRGRVQFIAKRSQPRPKNSLMVSFDHRVSSDLVDGMD